MTMRVGGLCAGYGGLEMGLAQVLDCEPAWFCEFADGPSKILAHRYPGVPNHRDLTTVDWDTVEPVDIVTAGWPCQPWSVAGAQKGADDERAIWPAIAGVVRALQPRYVCLENVSAVVAAGELARAVGDLAACGYDAQWVCVRASDVGAPHRRERIFILAADTGCEHGQRRAFAITGCDRREVEADRPRQHRSAVAHADEPGSRGRRVHAERGNERTAGQASLATADTRSARLGQHPGEPPPQEARARGGDEPSGDRGPRPAVDWGPYRAAISRWEHITGRRAPAPTEPGPRGGQRLSTLLVEWMMGLPAGWVTDVSGLSRTEQLKALGNGVVPQQATAAFTHLLQIAQEAA